MLLPVTVFVPQSDIVMLLNRIFSAWTDIQRPLPQGIADDLLGCVCSSLLLERPHCGFCSPMLLDPFAVASTSQRHPATC